jgi:hypothetical protein
VSYQTGANTSTDGETVDPALVPLLVGVVGVIGVSLGAWITSRANLSAAEEGRKLQIALAQESRETQRVLARDNARRARKEYWANRLLELVNRRYFMAVRLRRFGQWGDRSSFNGLYYGDWLEVAPLSEVGWLASVGFTEAPEILNYIVAEQTFGQCVERAMGDPDSDWLSVDQAQKQLRDRTEALFRAAERYIDADVDLTSQGQPPI